MTNRIRNASTALLFLVCLVALTSAFNFPNRSLDLSSRLASLRMAVKPAQQHTMLTLADRVAYQRAIEGVYWRHRIWPKENSKPKPSLDEVMSAQQIEKKVENYLRDSRALEDYWQKPIAPEQLQAEMERMARHTKQPEVLRELFEALGKNPSVIAEYLARPVLTERLVADLSAHDKGQRFALLRTQAAGSKFSITTSGKAAYTLPEIDPCTDDTWTPTSVISAPDGRQFQTAVWTGSEMIVWGGNAPGGLFNTGGRYNPATDSWTATSTTNAPTGRWLHRALWTGSEMIVWGGAECGFANCDLNTGGRYNPGTDSWTATNIVGAPAPRADHTAVWTGSEMIVWGGAFYDGSNHYLNTGGRYNPGTDSWTATSTTNAPLGRYLHTAVWTGSEMIVWAGSDAGSLLNNNTGGRYNPGSDSWTATSTTNAPLGRFAHTAVWTGSEMTVWGGYHNGSLSTGGKYNPGTDTWAATSTTNAPAGREYHTAVWTESEMIVWGGESFYDGSNHYLNTGGRYNPGTDSWTATSTANVPHGRAYHTAVWTGSEMIVWGGYTEGLYIYFNTGGRYCAQSAPMAQSAFSRKAHGAAGTFDVPLPLTGNVGVECRSGGATNDYQMIINFATTVTVGSASITSGTGSVSSFSVSGSQVTVNLAGVTNVQRITVTLFNVNDGTHMGNVPVSMGVLVGDVNGNSLVNASDVSLTKAQVGQPVTGSNFREDVNANGTISATDVTQVKAHVGTSLPP